MTAKINFSMLLASSGHDMKNVLGSVMESIDWLSNNINNLNEEQQQEFKKVINLTNVVNNELMQLLSLYKFEEKQYSITAREHSVADFLEFQMAFLIPLVAGSDVEVETDVDEEMMWIFDETLMSSAIRNAAMNALKFTKTKLLLKGEEKDGLLILSVHDDGPGYPENMCGKVADTVTGVDFTSGSTGLGLFFAEQVANLHKNDSTQGQVELSNDSQYGGAKFQITIP